MRINYQIRAPKIRLIDEKGTQVGIVETRRALEIARKKGLDLVEVAPQTQPPVCKIIDYGKYQYQKQKQAQKAKKKSKKTIIKGIRLSLVIGKHDLEFKARQAQKFLSEGHKVKVELVLRGRENMHLDLAYQELENFQKLIEEKVKIDERPRRLGNRIIMILTKA